MIRTCTLALLACAFAATPVGAQTTQGSQTTPTGQTKPASSTPDEWKFKKEKEAEAEKKAATQKKPAAKPKAPWRGWSDRAFISLNGGWQTSSMSTSDSREFEPSTAGDSERRTMRAEYAVESGVSLDLGGAVRLWKGLGAGVAVTRYEDSRDIAVTGSVPHPFFFNRARSVSGTAPGTREEQAVHVSAVWVAPVGRRLQLALFGGPSFYSVTQTVVTDFTFSESYPYDEATLTRVVTEDESGSVTGFHAGVDVGYYFTDIIGVGGIVRFGRASFESSLGSLDVGGPSFGAGVRLRIPQGRGRRP